MLLSLQPVLPSFAMHALLHLWSWCAPCPDCVTCCQGWRLEVKAYPILTEKGAWRGRGNPKAYGGFYTQDEVRMVKLFGTHVFLFNF